MESQRNQNTRIQMTVQRGGKKHMLYITQSMAKMLTSNQLDPQDKETIINNLIADQAPVQAPTQAPAADANSSDTCTSNSEALSTENSFKCWTEKEEKLLIDLRHERQENFRQSRNHSAIWKEIANEMEKTLNCKVSPQQALYKYNALKKKWKEIIDSPTGSATQTYVHKASFDEQYGTKASTAPNYSIDTDKDTETDDQKKSKSKKRKSSLDVATLIETHHTEYMEKATKRHNEKMEKFDRLLDIMQQDLQLKRQSYGQDDK